MPNIKETYRGVRNIDNLIYDVVGRTKTFFGMSPIAYLNPNGSIAAYQLGAYCFPWGEVYGTRDDSGILVTGRGTGKSHVMQELNGADIASWLGYFLQFLYGEDAPIPIDLVFVANVKKNAKKRLENAKRFIRQNPFLEKELIDYNSWTKEAVELKNGTNMYAEGASDNARGYHKRHRYGKVIYFLEEMAFWGGAQCMDSKDFVDNIASQSMGAVVCGYTTPYGKRGGAWHYWNHPTWVKWHVPSWANPYQDRRKLARKKAYLTKLGRSIVVDQEISGLFVEDAGLFFSNDVWIKATNPKLDWLYSGELSEVIDQLLSKGKQPGEFHLGIDPNKGVRTKDGDPVGINLTERVGRKYINRFTVAWNGVSEDDLKDMFKLMFKNLNIKKVFFDAGGGYYKGLQNMFKSFNPPITNMVLIDPQGSNVVKYMSNLRSAMMLDHYEMPESEDLRQSQLSMKGFGDQDDGEGEVSGKIKIQTDGKKSGIPCDLCAMGLTLAREKFADNRIAPMKNTEVITIDKERLSSLDYAPEGSDIYGGNLDMITTDILTVGIN